MRAIILAAGNGYQLDGYNKSLICDPLTGREILDLQLEALEGCRVTVVVGYRAINVMSRYRGVEYVYNPSWSVTNNSYSLALALSDEPSLVLSGDMIFGRELIDAVAAGPPNCVVTDATENRTPNSLNCRMEGERILELYQGSLRDLGDPEAVGFFKVSDPEILRAWRHNCLRHQNLFAGQNLPFEPGAELRSLPLGGMRLDEVNTPFDYIRLLERHRRAQGAE